MKFCRGNSIGFPYKNENILKNQRRIYSVDYIELIMAYVDFTVDRLKNLLRERGIRGYSGKKKAELIAMLEQHTPAIPTVLISSDQVAPVQRITRVLDDEIQLTLDNPGRLKRRYWSGDMLKRIRDAFDVLTLHDALEFMKEQLDIDLLEDYNRRKETARLLKMTEPTPYTQSRQIADVFMVVLEKSGNNFYELTRLAKYHPEEIKDPITPKLTRDKFNEIPLPLAIRFLRDKMQLTLPPDATNKQLADIFIAELQRRANGHPAPGAFGIVPTLPLAP